MSWYWPFKKKTRTARDGGIVAATVESPWMQTQPDIDRFVEAKRADIEALAKVTDLRPVDHRFKVGDRVLTVNGQHVWTVRSVAADYSSIVVVMTDTRGRQQVRRYEPYRLIRAGVAPDAPAR